MSFVNTIEFIESIMIHSKPHRKGLDHGCVKCLLIGALAMEQGDRLSVLPDGSIVPLVPLRKSDGERK